MLRICYFIGTHDDWGGASRALLNIIRRLDRRRFYPLVVMPRPGGLCEKLDGWGIEHRIWPKHERSRDLVAYGLGLLRSLRLFKRDRIDLIHLNYGCIGWKPAELLAARLAGIPVVSHLHVNMSKPSSFIRYSAVVLGVSQYVADHSDSLGVRKEVIHNLADLERFGGGRSIREELGFTGDDVLVTYLGQIKAIKGVGMFAELAHRLPASNVRFLIAGEVRKSDDSYTQEELERLIAGDERIRYLGYRDDVENIYRSSDIVVVPSQWDEPFGLVNVEAAASGKPVVATKVGGIPEIIDHGRSGYLVERDDLESMVRLTGKLIADRELRERMGRAARELVEERFSEQPMRRLERIYEELVRGGRGRAVAQESAG